MAAAPNPYISEATLGPSDKGPPGETEGRNGHHPLTQHTIAFHQWFQNVLAWWSTYPPPTPQKKISVYQLLKPVWL